MGTNTNFHETHTECLHTTFPRPHPNSQPSTAPPPPPLLAESWSMEPFFTHYLLTTAIRLKTPASEPLIQAVSGRTHARTHACVDVACMYACVLARIHADMRACVRACTHISLCMHACML